jgi:hypothetical protein
VKQIISVYSENLLLVIIDILKLIRFYNIAYKWRVVIFHFLQVLVWYEAQKIKTINSLIETKLEIVIYHYA